MTYNITLSDGTLVTLVPDNTVNSTAMPINLFGYGYVNYGMALNENFVSMLENFSDSLAPSNPLVGQLWYNDVQDILYLRSVSNNWVPLQVQEEPSYKEITVLDGNGNSAELDGTGNLYLQTENPSIGFLTNYSLPLANGQIVASIQLTSSGVLQITPGLNVKGNEIIQGSLDVSGSTTTNSLNVITSINTASLSTTAGALVNGPLIVEGSAAFGVQGVTVGSNMTTYDQTPGSANNVVIGYNGNIYLTRTNVGDYPEIDFNNTSNPNQTNNTQGCIKLVDYGTTGWNAGATVPFILSLRDGLNVQGNQNITGNLTVQGTITSVNSGGTAYLPLAGGTMSGDLIIDQPDYNAGLTITNNVHPILTLNATSSQAQTNGQASLILEVDTYQSALTHYINNAGQHILYMGPYGNGLFGLNMTNNFLFSFAPFDVVTTSAAYGQQIWANSAPLSLYSHSGALTGGPSLMFCDPGAQIGGQTVTSSGYGMGIALQGDNNNGGNPGGNNNYSLQFGIFNALTGQPASGASSNLMNLNSSGNLAVAGTIASQGVISCVGSLAIGATTIHDGDFSGNLTASHGYQKLPGGLIMMWGTDASASDNTPTTVTFGFGGFPNACFMVVATNTNLSSSNHINAAVINKSSFSLSNSPATGVSDVASWIALGN